MKEKGKVILIGEDEVTLSVIRKSSCGENCAHCNACTISNITVKAISEIDVCIGDVVEFESKTIYILIGLFTLFILPILLPLVFYLILLDINKVIAVFTCGFMFIISLILIYKLSRSKRYIKLTTPTIKSIICKK